MQRAGFPPRESLFFSNIFPVYKDGNPDPTPEDIAEWTPYLLAQLEQVWPQVIVAVGRFATRFFLGQAADMRAVHGIAHLAGEWGVVDDELKDTLPPGCIIVPVYHPASGLHRSDTRQLIDKGYRAAGQVIANTSGTLKQIRRRQAWASLPTDYRNITRLEDLTDYYHECLKANPALHAFGFDTEGTKSKPESFQVSFAPKTGVMVRCEIPEFTQCVAFIQYLMDTHEYLCVMHNRSYDVGVGQVMGFEFLDVGREKSARIWDSMSAAYLLRTEPQGLKALAWRHLGIRQESFLETVGRASVAKQVEYLEGVANANHPKPDKVEVRLNDGQITAYGPQSISVRASNIVKAVKAGKVDKDGNPVDPLKRWLNESGDAGKRLVQREMRLQAEKIHGPMPGLSLLDVDLPTAVHYASADADLALQLYNVLRPKLDELDVLHLMDHAMDISSLWEEMEAFGFPVDREYFEGLKERLTQECHSIQDEIIERFNDGKPFNPNSTVQVRALLERRNLKSRGKTKKQLVSTSKKAIEHLRTVDESIELIFRFREASHLITAFCNPILESSREDGIVRCEIKSTRTTSRRLASKNPNLLAMPSRSGPIIRKGFVALPGYRLVSADLKAIEMRMAAHIARDVRMCGQFRDLEIDMHKETASTILDIPVAEVTGEQKMAAKVAGFSILYGTSPNGLHDQLRMMGIASDPDRTEFDLSELTGENGESTDIPTLPAQPTWDVEECKGLIDGWLGVYKGIRRFIRDVHSYTYQTGHIRDMWGMWRFLPGVWAVDRRAQSEACRHAVSHLVQGAAQGCIQNSMVWLKGEIQKLRQANIDIQWVLQVHDEVILMCKESFADELEALIVEALENHHGVEDPLVPILADSQQGQSWGELK
jgi:uracil-DNA glycosylase family 4